MSYGKIGVYSRIALQCQSCPSLETCDNPTEEHVACHIPESDTPCALIDIDRDAAVMDALLITIFDEYERENKNGFGINL